MNNQETDSIQALLDAAFAKHLRRFQSKNENKIKNSFRKTQQDKQSQEFLVHFYFLFFSVSLLAKNKQNENDSGSTGRCCWQGRLLPQFT